MKTQSILLLTAVAALALIAGCERNNNPADDEGGKNFPEDGNIPRKLVLLFSEHTPYLEATGKEVKT